MLRIILAVVAIVFAIVFHIAIDGVNRRYYPTPGYDISSIPDQSGKVVIITGGTTGVGRTSAEQLCAKGTKLIIITSRSQSSADKAAKEIEQQYCSKDHKSKVIGKALALEDHKDIKKFAEWFRSLNEPLHVLMLNAGLGGFERVKTSLGLEKTIGVNWFGHFYLQQLLQDIVERSAPSRIVIVASRGAVMTPPLDKSVDAYVEGEESKGPHQYLYSKLYNVYHTRELHRRLREKGINNVYVNTLHPGLVATNIFDNVRGTLRFPFNYIQAIRTIVDREVEGGLELLVIAFLAEAVGLNPLDGSLTQLYAATSPDVEKYDVSGEYLYPIARREDKSWYHFTTLNYLTPLVKDEKLARKVWEYGESIIARIPKEQ